MSHDESEIDANLLFSLVSIQSFRLLLQSQW